MPDAERPHRNSLERQTAHWIAAAQRLDAWETWASPNAWQGLEEYLGLALREPFVSAIEKLRLQGSRLRDQVAGAASPEELRRARRSLLLFRSTFTRVETMLDFFGDAVNTRTSPAVARLLRACDLLAESSMRYILDQFGKPTARVLTYIDKGLGASILKAGLRLWDGTTANPVAAIKIVRHNLLRPTSLIHEAGHQVAHQLDWNNALAAALAMRLRRSSSTLADTWSGWASEIAADVFAFVHTGYASVAALHDVLAGEEETVFAFRPLDPHPVSFLRVLLCVEFCRICYGKGPWDELAGSWADHHPLQDAPGGTRALIARSLPLLESIADACLLSPLKALRGKTIVHCIDPGRVGDESLSELERQGGEALYTSTHWARTEGLRITALTGYRSAVRPAESMKYWNRQQQLMVLLGTTPQNLRPNTVRRTGSYA